MSDPAVTRLLDLAIQIQQIPAPTFAEKERVAFVKKGFKKEKLADVETDAVGNVYARLPGKGKARPLVLSAHLDTVFPLETNLQVKTSGKRICGPGLGDNSISVAALFGIVWWLRKNKIELLGDLWLVANVGEEGLGDLCGMKAIVERFGADPRAYVILEGLSYGGIYNQGLGVRRYRITARTAGGHAWGDYGSPSAIHELAALVTQLTALPVSKDELCSLNVGVIRGGTSVNTIAAEACLELDLRSAKPDALQKMAADVEAIVMAANKQGVSVQAEIIGDRPAGRIANDHPLVQLATGVLKEQGVDPGFWIGSTDANIPLSKGLPAICIGLTRGGGAHTNDEYILTGPLEDGLAQLYTLVQRAYQVLE
ncbi:MAG: M20/M25/M40 family metallo-hydrolase [Anaerolineales bacterium]|nr:M20/M25/M40 family metallo-hydrolase [Anaerolineales bacterium]